MTEKQTLRRTKFLCSKKGEKKAAVKNVESGAKNVDCENKKMIAAKTIQGEPQNVYSEKEIIIKLCLGRSRKIQQ